MYEFDYHRPANMDEAKALLEKHHDGALLSGGMTLIATMKQRLASPSDIIDLSGIGNAGVEVADGTVTVLAGTCHADVAADPEINKAIPALAELAGGIGDPHVRNRGTLGGSISNNDPAADYPAALVALNATVVTTNREIAAEQFFTGLFETALSHDEIVTAVRFPVPKQAGYAKFPNPASRYAMVGVFVAETAQGIRVAVIGAGPGVFRHEGAEQALAKSFSAESIPADLAGDHDLNDDIHGSAAYRAHLIGVMARRAVAAAK